MTPECKTETPVSKKLAAEGGVGKDPASVKPVFDSFPKPVGFSNNWDVSGLVGHPDDQARTTEAVVEPVK